MKNLPFLLSLVAIAPVVCVAQPQGASHVVVEPAARTLLDQATATYHTAKGIHFKLSVDEEKRQTRYSVSFQKPNLMRVEIQSPEDASSILSDGKATYSVQGTTYKKSAVPAEGRMLWAPVNSGTGFLTSAMLEGHSPVVALQETLKSAPFPNPRMTVKVPPPAVVDGVALHGVKVNFSSSEMGKASRPLAEIYIWFGDDGLLRRISTRDTLGQSTGQTTEKISDQELNPTFEVDTFKFDPSGLKLAVEPPAEQQQPEFDPRLKVGVAPIAFSAKTLKGQTISPANYKGRVLMVDFWATWCGPCVASMPELRSVYAKYHPKGLEVVGISLDEDKKALTSYLKTNKITWSQVFDGKGWESRVAGLYGVQSIPFFIIVGKNGKIAAVNPRDDLEGAVKRALAAK